MDAAQISDVLIEIKGELAVPSSYPNSVLEAYIKEGIYDIQAKVGSTVNFLEDYSARALLKAFVRYSYYGQRDVFKHRYDTEYLELQVRYVNAIE